MERAAFISIVACKFLCYVHVFEFSADWIGNFYTVFRKKVVYFVFERNFTTTGSIFLQFSMTITK